MSNTQPLGSFQPHEAQENKNLPMKTINVAIEDDITLDPIGEGETVIHRNLTAR